MFDSDFWQLYHPRQMMQREASRIARIGLVMAVTVLGFAIAGCSRRASSTTPAAKPPTVASLVPSAADLIVGMGAEDHLVAVSNYDHDPRTASLPRVGDYETTDWEKLSQIRPNVIVTLYGPTQTPAGFVDRARELGIRQVNLKLDRLPDVYDALAVLGNACNEPAKAAAEAQRIRQGIDQVRRRVAGEPRVRAILVIGAAAQELAGRRTFLDDLLTEAGGENAVRAPGYVTLDREALAALKPQVILQLIPGADDATRQKAAAFWNSFPDWPAVKENRLWPYTQTYIMLPGSHVPDVAAKFAQALHPQPTTQALP